MKRLSIGLLTASALCFSGFVQSADEPISTRNERALKAFEEAVQTYQEQEKLSESKNSLAEHQLAMGPLMEQLIETELNRFRPLMPDILPVLGARLLYRSPKEKRLDELSIVDEITEEEAAEWWALEEEFMGQSKIPLCVLAYVIGNLGRDAPEIATDILLSTTSFSNSDYMSCMNRALMDIGPAGYISIAKQAIEDKDLRRSQFAVLVILDLSQKTTFRVEVGLDNPEEMLTDLLFEPKRKRLHQIAKKWLVWWNENQDHYVWNPNTALLESAE